MGRLRELRPLVLVDTIEVGGAGKVALQSVGGLLEAGVPVCVANFRYEGRPSRFTREARELGAEVVELEQAHRLDFGCVERLAVLARERGVNLVESHSFKAHVAARRLLATHPAPWLGYAHGWTVETLRVRAYNWLERRLLREPDQVCVPAGTIADVLREAGRTRPITVLRNGIEASPASVDAGERAEARRALGLARTDFVIACVARLSREKGVDLLLRSAAELRASVPELRVLVAGDGPERRRLEAAVARLDLAEHVRLLGQVPDVRRVLAAADVVALPSRSEGLPNVALEALDAGVPLVATAVGALPELVRDGVTGWLVPPEDPACFAGALQRAHASPWLPAMGDLGRTHVLPAFSSRARLERLFGLYGDLVGRGPPPDAEAAA